MAKFRKKPVVIDAVLWDGSPSAVSGVHALLAGAEEVVFFAEDGSLDIPTLEGRMRGRG